MKTDNTTTAQQTTEQTATQQADHRQHTLQWYRARLGHITGSSAGKIIPKGRTKDAVFTQTGITYLMQIAAERMIPQQIVEDDEIFQCYLDEVNVTSKAMRIGNEREDEARQLYEDTTGNTVVEVGSTQHPDIATFASSPDGLTDDGGCVEIKCPTPPVYVEYATKITDAESLKAVRPEYYWQCISHMACTGAQWCDFIAYCPYNAYPLHIVRIDRDEDAIAELLSKIALAETFITSVIESCHGTDFKL